MTATDIPFCERYCVKPGTRVDLNVVDANETGDFKSKRQAKSALKHLREDLINLQERFYAWDKRSLHEDVLVVRVHDLVPESVWCKRYDEINAFEKLLVDSGATILKFYLHISKDEQARRLQARLDDPDKRWKFSKGDLKDRALWDDYQTAFTDAISLCSTAHAPWYVIPANHKWYRNYVIANILVETLKQLNPQFPEPEEGLDDIVIV